MFLIFGMVPVRVELQELEKEQGKFGLVKLFLRYFWPVLFQHKPLEVVDYHGYNGNNYNNQEGIKTGNSDAK